MAEEQAEQKRPEEGEPATETQPIEPPTAGFIVQLFLLPAIIVAIIVVVWLAFGQIAASGRSVEDYIIDLRSRNDSVRWPTAHELAVRLRHDPDLASDPTLARELVRLLTEAMDRLQREGAGEEEEARYRAYLVRALGAMKHGDPREIFHRILKEDPVPEVRSAVVWELAELVHDRTEFAGDGRIEQILIEAAADSDPAVRRHVAYALGVLATPRSLQELKRLVRDADRETRYNAAIALARNGDFSASDILLEMLTRPEPDTASAREAMAQYITEQALRAIKEGLKKGATLDEKLVEAVRQLADQADNPRIRSAAKDVVFSL